MRRILGIGLASVVVLGLIAGDAAARGGRGGGGGQGGGQQGMRGRGMAGRGYGYGYQAMQRQMMQSGYGNRNGTMWQQRPADGSCPFGYGQGYGQGYGRMQGRGMQGRQGRGQPGFGGQGGVGQQQRLRDGSCLQNGNSGTAIPIPPPQ